MRRLDWVLVGLSVPGVLGVLALLGMAATCG